MRRGSDYGVRRFAWRLIETRGDDALAVALEFARDREASGEYCAAALWSLVFAKIAYITAPSPDDLAASRAALKPLLADPRISQRIDRGLGQLGLAAGHVLVDVS